MKRNLLLSKLTSFTFIFVLGFLLNGKANANNIQIFEGKTSLDKPFELPDPFLIPKSKKKKTNTISSRKGQNVYDDSPSIAGVKLEDIEITGVVIGSDRRAFAKIKNRERVVVLKEGMRVGENDAELRAILPGGLVLVEKNINIYGEEEFLETVIPITN